MQNEVIVLLGPPTGVNAIGDRTGEPSRREVFAEIKSVGASYKLKALAAGLNPKYRFVLADYLDYDGETQVEYDGQVYKIIDTYRAQGNALELTVEGS